MHYNFETQPCNPYSGHEKVMLSVKLVIHVIIGLQLHRLWKVLQLAQWLEVQALEDQNDRIMIRKS